LFRYIQLESGATSLFASRHLGVLALDEAFGGLNAGPCALPEAAVRSGY
jgi:hypothetical protein